MKQLFSFLTVLIKADACSKNTTTDKDIEVPAIIITSPLNNQTFANGQTITISGSITDNRTIAEVHIHITDVANGSKYLDVHLYPASGHTDFYQGFMVSSGINYKIQIIAIDRSANQAMSSIQVSCN